MSRSIFDPTGPNTERSGSTFSGAEAGNRSHMPADVIDGVVDEADGTAADAVGFDGTGRPVEPTAGSTPVVPPLDGMDGTDLPAVGPTA